MVKLEFYHLKRTVIPGSSWQTITKFNTRIFADMRDGAI